MMTEPQLEIFRKVLDTNWEMEELIEARKWNEMMQKSKEHNAHVQELKELMGETEYNNFINLGRKMFAPVGGGVNEEDD